ncbi:hypothetical protein Q9R19_10505 [Microbacterium sp. ARD32]|uniref:hypothetical protein n=1 Tax=Microbacterium sp. ARD32 TaxID=2962577 RepID=UPI002880CB8E|nr:hypothetical protein [Microbacterium sp. ARD32]MDT0158053.1 hypothetical protein [Microbacterium sp. ARD32]
MVDVDAGVSDAASRRRTWMLGGGLLTASALLHLWATSVPGAGGFEFVPDLLFTAGLVVFAIGLGASGSVTARRPLGTVALIALAVWLPAAPLLQELIVPSNPMGDMVDGNAGAQLIGMVGISTEVVSLGLALIAVVQIGRIGVIPHAWRWAPLWALAAVVAMRLLSVGLLMGPIEAVDQNALVGILSLLGFLGVCAVGFLGVLAIVLAARPVRGTTRVYSSGQ